jgi:hypothetical protein
MSLGADTSIINGQRVPLFTNDAFAPHAYVPVAPVGVAQNYPTGAPIVGGGGSTAETQAVHAAQNAPFSFVHSPLPWAVTFIVIGLLGLRIIHWRFLDKEL